MSYGSSADDAYSAGYDLTRDDVWSILSNAINNGDFASSTDALYIVLISRQPSPYLTSICRAYFILVVLPLNLIQISYIRTRLSIILVFLAPSQS